MGEEKIRTSVAEVHRVVAAALVRAVLARPPPRAR